jgi:hypothetical protein
MNAKISLAAAALCLLGGTTASVSAGPLWLTQNVEYMICVTKTDNATRCEVREARDPCQGPVASPRPHYGGTDSACKEAKQRPECSGGVTGCR